MAMAVSVTVVVCPAGSADARPAELLVLFGRQGERAHLRARTTWRPVGGHGCVSLAVTAREATGRPGRGGVRP